MNISWYNGEWFRGRSGKLKCMILGIMNKRTYAWPLLA